MAKRNKNLQSFLETAALELAIMDSSDEEAEELVFDELEENAAVFAGLRYAFRGKVPKSFNWYDETLPNLDDQRFRMMLRCTRTQFNVILALIENHPVFHGANSQKQFSTQFQLAIVLYRLGSNGDGATLGKIASLFGVGDGGSIDKVTSRVFEAILSLEEKFLNWPSAEERAQLSLDNFGELPHCIGYVDGTEIPLQERPTWDWDPTSYYSRNKQYSIKLQAVCDAKIRFRHLVVGYPGSVHDARIYNNCKLGIHPQKYFSEPQYLGGDSAYKLTSTLITPFRVNSTTLIRRQRVAFNRYFSSYRVRIEHGFGILKEKLPSLKNLSIRIKDETSHKFACTWIRVCCILHNVLLPYFDDEDISLGNIHRNQQETADEESPEDEDEEEGVAKRIALLELIAERGVEAH